MLPYNPGLRHPARVLRRTMTDAERLLWSRVRGKQIGPVQFYRQKPLGDYIVDFHAPKAKTVVYHGKEACKGYVVTATYRRR